MYGIYDNGMVIAKFTAPLSVVSNKPIFVSDSLSLKHRVAKRSAQRWEVSSNLEPLSYNANELFALFVRKGYSETVQITIPQNFGAAAARTSVSTVPTATGSASATSVAVVDNTGIIPVGTFIRFANHSKVYMLTSTLTGAGVMSIFPELRVAVSGTVFSFKTDVLMNCYIETDTVMGMAYSDGILMDLGTVKLVEAV